MLLFTHVRANFSSLEATPKRQYTFMLIYALRKHNQNVNWNRKTPDEKTST